MSIVNNELDIYDADSYNRAIAIKEFTAPHDYIKVKIKTTGGGDDAQIHVYTRDEFENSRASFNLFKTDLRSGFDFIHTGLNLGQWYIVELKNIDYENDSFDIYLDGELISEKPIFCTLTFQQKAKGFFTIFGNTPKESMNSLARAGACVVGANCSARADHPPIRQLPDFSLGDIGASWYNADCFIPLRERRS